MQDAETVALGLALEAAGDMKGGFSIADVEEVEAVWSLIDGKLATYGFVLRIAGMGRQYLELTLDDVASRGEAEIELMDLGDTEDLPDFEGADWNTEPDHLNERLAHLKRN